MIYMAYMSRFKLVYIEAMETYSKQSYRNRVEFMAAGGKSQFSVPVIKTFGNHTKTCDIKISYAEKWQNIFWRAIEAGYNSSPYFLYYKDGLREILFNDFEFLSDLNISLLSKVLEWTGIETKLTYTSSYVNEYPGGLDLRSIINPKKPIGDMFFPEYTQVFSDKFGFLPNLSIIDTIFNLGPGTLQYLESIEIPGLFTSDIQSWYDILLTAFSWISSWSWWSPSG